MTAHIVDQLQQAGGWLPFDRFMAMALYTPGLGYYANDLAKLGRMPSDGSDFVTAPELSPWFGHVLAGQINEALQATQTHDVWEFGAGSGALAFDVLTALDALRPTAPVSYHIVDVSGALRARQQARLQAWAGRVHWHDQWPQAFEGVLVGNEVLDAMPVQLLVRKQGVWHERGVAWHNEAWVWSDRPTHLRPAVAIEGEHDYLTEIHPQAEAFVASLAEHWTRGLAFFIDYGFEEAAYYHPQRHMGTLMCHQGHRADPDPLVSVGLKDITAHVNFTGVAVAAQNAGLLTLGYLGQGRFLLNAGLMQAMAHAPVPEQAQALKLVHEHEMGELFKVWAVAPQATVDALPSWWPTGFAHGDRSHAL